MDDGVVRRVIGPVPGQVDPLAPDLERAAILEGLLVRGPSRVVVTEQQTPCLLVTDAGDVLVEQRRCPYMVGVVMGVDKVVDLVGDAVCGGDLVDGAPDVVPDRRRRVEQDDTVRGGQKGRLVGAVSDPVEVSLDSADVVPLLVDRRAESRAWDWRKLR